MFKEKIKILGNIIMIVCIFFVLYSIYKLGINKDIFYIIRDSFWQIFLLSFVCAWLVYLNAFNWNVILKILSNKRIATKDIIRLYSKANLGKYLPGNIMHFVGRNVIGRKYGLSHSNMVTSTLIEISMLLFSSICFLLLFVRKEILTLLNYINTKYYIIYLLLLIVILILGIVYYKKIVLFLKKLKLNFTRVSIFKMFILLFLYLFTFIISALVFYKILNLSSNGIINLNLFVIISSYQVAWLIGFITPGSPGGVGVRETVLILSLSPFIKKEYIIIAIVIHRFITILGDILAYLIINSIYYLKKIKSEEKT